MTKAKIRDAVFDSIAKVQSLSGVASCHLDEDLLPQADLQDFDSLRYSEVECLVSEHLGVDLNFRELVDSSQKLQDLTLGEVIDRLHNRLTGQKEQHA